MRKFPSGKSPHEPSPHPDPLPSHRMGAEREQPAEAIGCTEVCRAATGSGEQCASCLGGNLCPPSECGETSLPQSPPAANGRAKFGRAVNSSNPNGIHAFSPANAPWPFTIHHSLFIIRHFPFRALFAQLCATIARLGECVRQETWSFAGKTAFYSLGTLIAYEERCSAFGGSKCTLPIRTEP